MTASDWDVGVIMSAQALESEHASPALATETTADTSQIPNIDGGFTHIRYDAVKFRDVCHATCTREPLPTALDKDAIKDELNTFNSRVWALVDAKRLLRQADSRVIRTRWVMCNKGGTQSPGIRARLVACELNAQHRRLRCQHATTRRKPDAIQ